MAEGLGLAPSVIAVLQITSSVISLCNDYTAAVQGSPWELTQVRTELMGLRDVLDTIEPLAKRAEFGIATAGRRLETFSLLVGPQGLLQNCLKEIKRLESSLNLLPEATFLDQGGEQLSKSCDGH
jgi:hypothetical protein